MVTRLSTKAPDFEAAFRAFLTQKREVAEDVDAAVRAIVDKVRAEGDAALIALTARFDGMELTPERLAFSPQERAEAAALVPPDQRRALERAAERITAYHEKQRPADAFWQDNAGVGLGWRWRPVQAAGLYVPGGTASYPSSVLMNAIPARVAGVQRLVMTCPTPGGKVSPLVLVAAEIAGIETIYRLGGAQAIAALAYGTETIAPVDKITGPGNAYVAAAKRQVFGQVGIDMIAGPSEVVILADGENDPTWIALDLLAQAEHDESAQAVLITQDAAFAAAVASAVEAALVGLPRRAIAAASWAAHGAIILVRDWAEGAALSNRIAPEHLQICTANPEALAAQTTEAGAIFLGPWTPEAFGDYIGGPNHVLPTARSARFSSGLSVLDFMKRTTLTAASPTALAALGPAAETLARSEGLTAHAESLRARVIKANG